MVISPSGNLVKPLDWLLRSSDHFPQLVGIFDTLVTDVTIQLWDVTNGQNTPVSIVSCDCYQIGDTGRWGWSTVDLPITSNLTKQYFYIMTSNIASTFDGQLIMSIPKGSSWLISELNNGI